MSHKHISLSIVILLSVVGILIFYDKTDPVGQISGKKIIKVGWIGSLSDQNDQKNEEMGNRLNAFRMAIDEYNHAKESKYHIEISEIDDRGLVSESERLYSNLVKNKNTKIIILNSYETYFEVTKINQENRALIVNPVLSDQVLNQLSDDVVMTGRSSESLAEAIVDDIIGKKVDDVLILTDQKQRHLVPIRDHFKTLCSKTGLKCDQIAFDPDLDEPSQSILSDSLAKGRKSYVFLGGPEFFDLFSSLKSGEPEALFYGLSELASFVDREGESELMYPFFRKSDGQVNLIKEFNFKYYTSYGYTPKNLWQVCQSYDTGKLLVNALNQIEYNPESIDIDQLRDQFLKNKNYKGLSGLISMNPDGTSSGIQWSLYRVTAVSKSLEN